MITLVEAARELDVSYARLWRGIADNLVNATRVGRGWFISPDELERLKRNPISVAKKGKFWSLEGKKTHE